MLQLRNYEFLNAGSCKILTDEPKFVKSHAFVNEWVLTYLFQFH